jgi:hypothetical protein
MDGVGKLYGVRYAPPVLLSRNNTKIGRQEIRSVGSLKPDVT